MDTPLFPVLPEDLATLTDEELNEHLAASLEAKDRIVAQDPEFLGELSATEILDTMKTGVAGILALKAEQATRVEAETNLATELATLAAQVDPEVDTALAATEEQDLGDGTEADAAIDEPPAAVVEEPVVAAVEQPRPLRRAPLPAQGRHQAIPQMFADQPGQPLVAAAGLQRIGEGKPMTEDMINRSFVEKMGRGMEVSPRELQRLKAASGVHTDMFGNEIYTCAGGKTEPVGFRDLTDGDLVPDQRRLVSGDPRNREKIEALVASARKNGVGYPDDFQGGYTEAVALTASGGICAPVTPYYQLAFISEVARPVRDSLVGFIADRGGITYAPPPYLGEITTGVGVITAAQDLAGGTAGTKTCQTLICPGFLTVEVNAIFHCFQGGNLGQRAFPEQASQFSSLILAQHARVAETQLLNQIKAGSTNVNGQSTVLGAISSLLNDILVAAAAYRSNNRMDRAAPLQAILPQWTGDLLLIDLIQSQFQRFSMDQSGLEALFAAFNIRVTWTMDGPTDGEGQILARQTAGTLTPFPTVVEWALFHPGAWLFVDSGTLELGIVRDSVLNATNSYQVFGESWEAAAGIGVQSLWVTSNVCPTGAVALAVSNTHQCGT